MTRVGTISYNNKTVKFYYDNVLFESGHFLSAYEIVTIYVPADGHCLFHSILLAYSNSYYNSILNGTTAQFITRVRSSLARRLGSKINDSQRYYDIINGGTMGSFGIEEFNLREMQQVLNSSSYVGYGYMDFIGMAFDKDIYILDETTKDIYINDLKYTITGTRPSIILHYVNNNHYQLIGGKRRDGTIRMHFNPTSPLIRKLYGRVKEILAAVKD